MKQQSIIIQEIANILKSDYKLDIIKADDQNKGGNIKDCILHYYLKEKLAKEFGGKYNIDKTYIVISGNKMDLDHQTLKYLNKNRITIKENNKYEILKASRGDNLYDNKMCKYVKKIIDKINIASKLKNNYQKMKQNIKTEDIFYMIMENIRFRCNVKINRNGFNGYN